MILFPNNDLDKEELFYTSKRNKNKVNKKFLRKWHWMKASNFNRSVKKIKKQNIRRPSKKKIKKQ